MVLSTYLRLLIFLLAILIPACALSSLAFHMMYSACKLNKKGDNKQPWRFLSQFGTSCPMLSSNCCFLTCIQVYQKAGKVIWYSYLLKNLPQFVVIHTVKGFSIVNEPEVDIFLEFSCFFYNQTDVGNLISGFFAFSKSVLTSGSSQFMYCWSLAWRITWNLTLLVCEMTAVLR